MSIEVKFWGVRGSTPTPCIENLGIGGNTTCIEVRSNGQSLIIDAGTGIRQLGRTLNAESEPRTIDILLTHFHWDHIQGLPFFAPLMKAGNTIRFHSFPDEHETQRRLEGQMCHPYFTLDFKHVRAKREFRQATGDFQIGTFAIRAFPLNHPQGACGYRIESAGRSVVIATDVEHGNPELDRVLRNHSQSADLLVYDSQYSPAEYELKKGWGHSTYPEAAKLAHDAHVRQLALFHHDPTHNDSEMNSLLVETQRLFENTILAKELETLVL